MGPCDLHRPYIGGDDRNPAWTIFCCKTTPQWLCCCFTPFPFSPIIFLAAKHKKHGKSLFGRSYRYQPRFVFPPPFPKRTQRPPQRPTKARSFSCPASLLTMMPCMRTWRRSWFQQHRMCPARLDILGKGWLGEGGSLVELVELVGDGVLVFFDWWRLYLIICNVMLYLIIDMYINIYIYIVYLLVDVLMYCFKTNINPPLKIGTIYLPQSEFFNGWNHVRFHVDVFPFPRSHVQVPD